MSLLPLCMHVCLVLTGQKKVSHPLELELKGIVSHHVGQGTHLGSSEKATHTLYC